MTPDQVVDYLQRHLSNASAGARDAGPGFPGTLEKALPRLDEESREMAADALAANNSPEAERVLLNMTGDREPQVAAAAAHALFRVAKRPAPNEVLVVLPRRQEPVVRSLLYRLVGEVGAENDLKSLRTITLAEKDAEAAEDAQAAAVRLKGQPERAALMERARRANPEAALRVCDQIRYIGQQGVLKALLPWLHNYEDVMRLGSDRKIKMARMCDLAVWTAVEMGVKIEPKPAGLDNYPKPLLDNAETAIRNLPD